MEAFKDTLPIMYNGFNPNSLDNKGSWSILKDLYCSVTMLRELGLMQGELFCQKA